MSKISVNLVNEINYIMQLRNLVENEISHRYVDAENIADIMLAVFSNLAASFRDSILAPVGRS